VSATQQQTPSLVTAATTTPSSVGQGTNNEPDKKQSTTILSCKLSKDMHFVGEV